MYLIFWPSKVLNVCAGTTLYTGRHVCFNKESFLLLLFPSVFCLQECINSCRFDWICSCKAEFTRVPKNLQWERELLTASRVMKSNRRAICCKLLPTRVCKNSYCYCSHWWPTNHRYLQSALFPEASLLTFCNPAHWGFLEVRRRRLLLVHYHKWRKDFDKGNCNIKQF